MTELVLTPKGWETHPTNATPWEAVQELAAYQQTGLTPEEVAGLQNEKDILQNELDVYQMKGMILPAHLWQSVYVLTQDGAIYECVVRDVECLRRDAGPVMKAVCHTRKGKQTFMITEENKGVTWFDLRREAEEFLNDKKTKEAE